MKEGEERGGESAEQCPGTKGEVRGGQQFQMPGLSSKVVSGDCSENSPFLEWEQKKFLWVGG